MASLFLVKIEPVIIRSVGGPWNFIFGINSIHASMSSPIGLNSTIAIAKGIPSVIDECGPGDASLRILTGLRRHFDILGQTSGSPEFPNAFIVESQARMNFVTAASREVLTGIVLSVVSEN